MKNSKQLWWTVSGSVLIGLGVVTYVWWLKNKKQSKAKAGQKIKIGAQAAEPVVVGSTSGKAENKAETISEPNWNDPFDGNYAKDVKRWVAPKKVLELNPKTAKQFAQGLYKAKGGAWYKNDNEKAVLDVFSKKLRDKVQVANLSLAFWKLYQKDMWGYLRSFLSNKEMEKYVSKPVRQLPKYRIAT